MSEFSLSVESIGSNEWPRFIIKNNRDQVWTGGGWSEEPSYALLYDCGLEAEVKASKLREESHSRVFVGSFALKVGCSRQVAFDELKELLSQSHCGMYVIGSLQEFDLEMEVNWDNLEEI